MLRWSPIDGSKLLHHLCSCLLQKNDFICAPMWERSGARGCCCFYVDPASCRAPVSETVFLARHASHAEVGHILSGRSDIALNDEGRLEAERLAKRLAAVPLAAVFSSPCRRARETADHVAARHALPVEDRRRARRDRFRRMGRAIVRQARRRSGMGSLERGARHRRHGGRRGHGERHRRACRAPHRGGSRRTTGALRQPLRHHSRGGRVLSRARRQIACSASTSIPPRLTTLALHGGGARIVPLNERSV